MRLAGVTRYTLVLTLCALLCSSQRVSRADSTPQPEIRIGGIFDLTGGGALWGKTERNSFLLACRDFEAKSPSTKVTAIVEDSTFSSRQTVTALHKLISIDKVTSIVGATWETTVAMMPICEANRVVCMSPSYHGREYYNRSWSYNFTAWFDDREYARALALQMNASGYKKVAIFAALTPYYDTLVESFVTGTTSTIITNQRMVLEERDFRSIITKVPRDVDAIVMLLDNAGQIQAFLKQWSELRSDRPPVFSDDLIVYLDPPDDIHRFGFEFYYSRPIFDTVTSDDFTARYQRQYGVAPEGSSGAVTYDETMILLNCMKASSSTKDVRECVASTVGYHGYSGEFSFGGGQTVTNRKIGVQKLAKR
jgi:branched-chain amino acid transport system substrate-binding protein